VCVDVCVAVVGGQPIKGVHNMTYSSENMDSIIYEQNVVICEKVEK